MALLVETPHGLYCEKGDFYVDPWRPVRRAVITHAHSDHARWGCQHYLAARSGEHLLRMRLGDQAEYQFVEYGERITIGSVQITLFPAGHMTGSAQVCLQHGGETMVVSGDYNLQTNPTCATFEPVPCHTFVTESTFGLPIYRWDEPHSVFGEINDWWRENQMAGRCSVLLAYTIGKTQRLMTGIDPHIGPIFAHGAIVKANEAYAACGVQLPDVRHVSSVGDKFDWSQSLVLAPPSVAGSSWLRRFGDPSIAMASGWMRVRGIRRRRSVDRGFVVSDHADWDGLLTAIRATGATSIWVTHGYTEPLVKYLRTTGLDAREVRTEFRGELEGDVDTVGDVATGE